MQLNLRIYAFTQELEGLFKENKHFTNKVFNSSLRYIIK